MDYEQYKGKLLEVKNSLELTKKFIEKECDRYTVCIKDMHEIGDSRRTELITAVEKKVKEKLSQIDDQIYFISELTHQVEYKQIWQECNNNKNQSESKNNTSGNILPKKEPSYNWSKRISAENNFNNFPSNVAAESKSSSENVAKIDEFTKLISDFMGNLNNNLRYNTLCLSREWSKKLSKYNLIKWKEFDEEKDITLEETNDTPTYYAYEISSKPSYYFLTPADGIGINEILAAQYAYLAFFDFPTEELGAGKKPVVVKPAIVTLKDGIYSFLRKGVLKF